MNSGADAGQVRGEAVTAAKEPGMGRIRGFGVLMLVVILAANAGGQEAGARGPVLLRWKVPPEEVLAFRTSMSPVDPSKENVIRFDLESLAQGEDLPAEAKGAIDELRLPTVSSMTSLLRKLPSGNLSVKMTVGKVTTPTEAGSEQDEWMAEMMKKMEGTVQLRGEITDSGEVASFYMESKQKNLLAVFFELPKEPVKVGDTWSLDVNFVAMGHGFICDEASRTNRVKLTRLTKTEDGDVVASLHYLIAESVKGRITDPFAEEGQAPSGMPTSMSMSFVGRGEFLVNKGTWKQLVGRMTMKGTGMMSADVQQHVAMEPMASAPKELLSLE